METRRGLSDSCQIVNFPWQKLVGLDSARIVENPKLKTWSRVEANTFLSNYDINLKVKTEGSVLPPMHNDWHFSMQRLPPFKEGSGETRLPIGELSYLTCNQPIAGMRFTVFLNCEHSAPVLAPTTMPPNTVKTTVVNFQFR